MKKILYLSILSILMLNSACKLSTTAIEVLLPAELTLPDSLKSVGIVNRTYPTKNNNGWNIAEGILTGEGIGTDRRGSEAETDGLINTMQQSPRFKLNRLNITQLKGSGTGAFPEPLDWTIVGNICRDNKVDALICLEAFDTDSRVDFVPVTLKKPGPNNTSIDVPGFQANSRMNVTSGFRIYYPAENRILDEHRFTDFLSFSANGLTREEALSKLPTKMDAMVKTAIHAGNAYGYRISPMWQTQSRSWYKKGSPKLLNAAHKVRGNDWRGAAELWKMDSQNTDHTAAGRACFNMAVYSEMNGNLEVAYEWAQKAFLQHNLKRAKSYMALIKNRQNDAKILDQQMAPVKE